MERPSPQDDYRAQATVCTAMAEAAPTPEIRRHWLALAESYTRAADALAASSRRTGTTRSIAGDPPVSGREGTSARGGR